MTTKAIDIMDRIRKRAKADPSVYIRQEFAVELNDTKCVDCCAILWTDGKPVKSSAPKCACGRPWNRVCRGWDANNRDRKCVGDTWERPRLTDRGWTEPTCAPCRNEPKRAHRRARQHITFPTLPDKIKQAKTYEAKPHRAELDHALKTWPRHVLLVWGPCGSGKTVAVVKWALERNLNYGDVLWVASRDLIQLFKAGNRPDDDMIILRKALKTATVLIVDEFLAAGARDWTVNVALGMQYLLQDRLDRSDRKTVFITNKKPEEVLAPAESGGPMSDMVLDRFRESGRSVACLADSMRNEKKQDGTR